MSRPIGFNIQHSVIQQSVPWRGGASGDEYTLWVSEQQSVSVSDDQCGAEFQDRICRERSLCVGVCKYVYAWVGLSVHLCVSHTWSHAIHSKGYFFIPNLKSSFDVAMTPCLPDLH